MSNKNPEQFSAFKRLVDRLITVPKSAVDKQMDEYNKRKAERKKAARKKR